MLSLFTGLIAQANSDDVINLAPGGGLAGDLQGLRVPGIISAGIRLTLVVAAVIFFFVLVIGGIRWITSGGDKAQTEAARSQITAALVGLVIVFAAWAIVALVGNFFGIELLNGLQIPSAGQTVQ